MTTTPPIELFCTATTKSGQRCQQLLLRGIETTHCRSHLTEVERAAWEKEKAEREKWRETTTILRYPAYLPKVVPPDRWLAHNHVIPPSLATTENGHRGFRFFFVKPESWEVWEVCGCGWAPKLERHYRGRRSPVAI